MKDAEPAIAGTPDPAKTKNLQRLNRELGCCYAVNRSIDCGPIPADIRLILCPPRRERRLLDVGSGAWSGVHEGNRVQRAALLPSG